MDQAKLEAAATALMRSQPRLTWDQALAAVQADAATTETLEAALLRHGEMPAEMPDAAVVAALTGTPGPGTPDATAESGAGIDFKTIRAQGSPLAAAGALTRVPTLPELHELVHQSPLYGGSLDGIAHPVLAEQVAIIRGAATTPFERTSYWVLHASQNEGFARQIFRQCVWIRMNDEPRLSREAAVIVEATNLGAWLLKRTAFIRAQITGWLANYVPTAEELECPGRDLADLMAAHVPSALEAYDTVVKAADGVLADRRSVHAIQDCVFIDNCAMDVEPTIIREPDGRLRMTEISLVHRPPSLQDIEEQRAPQREQERLRALAKPIYFSPGFYERFLGGNPCRELIEGEIPVNVQLEHSFERQVRTAPLVDWTQGKIGAWLREQGCIREDGTLDRAAFLTVLNHALGPIGRMNIEGQFRTLHFLEQGQRAYDEAICRQGGRRRITSYAELRTDDETAIERRGDADTLDALDAAERRAQDKIRNFARAYGSVANLHGLPEAGRETSHVASPNPPLTALQASRGCTCDHRMSQHDDQGRCLFPDCGCGK